LTRPRTVLKALELAGRLAGELYGFEGYVAKDEASPDVGGITRSWFKVKVPGWTDPEDRWRRVRLDAEKRDP
jgi:hypothetical protein